ncbi:hypothetical protein D1872_287530 [compost metagenome]
MPEAIGVHYRYHAVQSGQPRKINTGLLIGIGEGLSHRNRLADACRFNQDVIKTPFIRQSFDLLH